MGHPPHKEELVHAILTTIFKSFDKVITKLMSSTKLGETPNKICCYTLEQVSHVLANYINKVK